MLKAEGCQTGSFDFTLNIFCFVFLLFFGFGFWYWFTRENWNWNNIETMDYFLECAYSEETRTSPMKDLCKWVYESSVGIWVIEDNTSFLYFLRIYWYWKQKIWQQCIYYQNIYRNFCYKIFTKQYLWKGLFQYSWGVSNSILQNSHCVFENREIQPCLTTVWSLLSIIIVFLTPTFM